MPDRELESGLAAVQDATGDVARPGGLELTDQAMVACGLPPGARVLDVGCGAGATVRHLRVRHGLSAFGVDVSLHLAGQGCGSPAAEVPPAGRAGPLLRAGAEALPLAEGSLHAVLAECTVSVLPEPGRALAEFHRVLRPDGFLVISDLYLRNPQARDAVRVLPAGSCLRGALVAEDLVEDVKGHGFEVVLWQDHGEALRRLAAQLIWTHGSLDRLWCHGAAAAAPGQHGAAAAAPTQHHAGAAGSTVNATITAARPSYFLLVAQKRRG